MKLLGNGLAHAMHLVTASRTSLLGVGKVIFDTLSRQVFRQGLAAALLSRRPFARRQARVRQDNDMAIFAVGGVSSAACSASLKRRSMCFSLFAKSADLPAQPITGRPGLEADVQSIILSSQLLDRRTPPAKAALREHGRVARLRS